MGLPNPSNQLHSFGAKGSVSPELITLQGFNLRVSADPNAAPLTCAHGRNPSHHAHHHLCRLRATSAQALIARGDPIHTKHISRCRGRALVVVGSDMGLVRFIPGYKTKLPRQTRLPLNTLHNPRRSIFTTIPRSGPYAAQDDSKLPKLPIIGRSLQAEQIDQVLSQPVWSVQPLIPSTTHTAQQSVSIDNLLRLLRISALPAPQNEAEGKALSDTLMGQLHFVDAIRKVDTSEIHPLKTIRDETAIAERETEITVDKLSSAFAKENSRGRRFRRITRSKVVAVDPTTPAEWSPLAHAEKTNGKYFHVDYPGNEGAL